MRRYDCLQAIAPALKDELVVTNLANTATEWRALRPHEGNLYFVGMGMVTPYALGLALALPQRPVLALDGDGGILFDLSALATAAQTAPANLCIVVFDNGRYASTGTLPSTVSLTGEWVDLEVVARGLGLKQVEVATTVDGFAAAVVSAMKAGQGPSLVIAKVDEAQAFVGTTAIDSKENKYHFVRHVEAAERKTILRPSAKEHGAAPKPDPVFAAVADGDDVSQVLHQGLRENGVDFVVGLPCSGFAKAQALCLADPDLRYVGVANEGTGLAICAGAWLGGKRPAALIENFGLFAAAYQLLRGHSSYGIPTLILAEYRGDAGDQEFFAETGDMTEPFLSALRINHRVVRDIKTLKPAIRDGLRWMDIALRPYAVLPGFDLTRPRR
jgi:sulfopyruvate decarboxylase TPP-binding subunit